ncbi:phosphomannomutase [Shewanella sp. 6_MG-2023]|uniref:phosphomannomutase n=1 Tax=Shewanella sp. 6_MG-2023 TaxID=3062660 RepID=UPI0026E47137|nr:phosphomannomutase [Shewanella sp. 6_MG-2023]MDO6617607.1 phosphomannomutase [Shewanella sp. 6_MG-2023]
MSDVRLNSSNVLSQSQVKFGTSGARGLVTDFSSDVCAAFTAAFIKVMQQGFDFDTIALAIDNRPSSQAMAQASAAVAKKMGFDVVYYGVIPTPALAYVAMQQNIPSIMITGSHIPFDRNGIKFYRPDGEISKQDEQSILQIDASYEPVTDLPQLTVDPTAAKKYIERYASLYQGKPLSGKHIGIYEHSSAGRDLYPEIFTKLGAQVTSLERSNTFVPIDTEAVSEEDKQKACNWSKEYGFDAIFSTDGDGDRPLVADENGEWLRGDILGLLCADALNIESLAVPVSCNTAIELSNKFIHVARTKIGSPYVIAEFASLNNDYKSSAGFEANGGFLLGSDIDVDGYLLKALPTRDAVLPFVAVLLAAKETGISAMLEQLPNRETSSDRIQNFATEKSLSIIAQGTKNPQQLIDKLGFCNLEVQSIDTTDGLRILLSNGDLIHLRPSGNAPELRCYAEASSHETAQTYVQQALTHIKMLD